MHVGYSPRRKPALTWSSWLRRQRQRGSPLSYLLCGLLSAASSALLVWLLLQRSSDVMTDSTASGLASSSILTTNPMNTQNTPFDSSTQELSNDIKQHHQTPSPPSQSIPFTSPSETPNNVINSVEYTHGRPPAVSPATAVMPYPRRFGKERQSQRPVRTSFPDFAALTATQVRADEAFLSAHGEAALAERRVDRNAGVRVCIMTFAFVGPIKNGGIATADTAMAEALHKAGFDVTVVYLWGNGVQLKTMDYWIKHYRHKGIKLVPLRSTGIKFSPSSPSKYVRKAYEAYMWLRARDGQFDIVHFHEWHGPGYYVALAKHQGLAFQKMLIWTTVHCPSLFYLFGNSGYLTTWNNFASDFLERKQVLYSDLVVSPSNFMLQWVQRHGWTLPPLSFVQQNILADKVVQWREEAGLGKERSTEAKVVRVEEFVFFARLELLKGIREFCGALDILAKEVVAGSLRTFRVTFLGNPNMGDKDAVKYVNNRAKDGQWPFKPKAITDYIQPQAIGYMRGEPGRVSVLASLVENSPYTVLECLALEIPFLCSNVGGIPELIHEEDRDLVMFTPTAKELASRMRHVINNGVRLARGTSDPETTKQRWVAFHNAVAEGRHATEYPESMLPTGDEEQMDMLREQVRRLRTTGDANPTPRFETQPLVTVIIPTHDRGVLLLKTLDALLGQDYGNFEIILVDDGSQDAEHLRVLELAKAYFGNGERDVPFRLIEQENLYPGAARNHGAREARGEFIMFMDDDDLPRPHMISTMVHVAMYTGADVVTCMADFFHGDGVPSEDHHPDLRWLPVGAAADLGMWHNVFGAYSALVRLESFWAIGGFSEDYGTTFEDYEFFADAVLKGFKLELVPEPLLWYRQNPGSHLMKTTTRYLNRLRALRPYLHALPPDLRQAFVMGYGVTRRKK